MNRVELKEKAKESLKGKWKEAVKIQIVYLLIAGGFGFVQGILEGIFSVFEKNSSLFSDIITIILTALFTLGLSSFYLKIARNEDVNWKELFSKINMFWITLLLMFLVAIYTTLWSLLLIIPGIIAAISYSQVYFIMLDNPMLKASEAIKKSKEMMYGHKMDCFILTLSFIGWIIVGALTLGIGFLWIIPYMGVTEANFYDSIKN